MSEAEGGNGKLENDAKKPEAPKEPSKDFKVAEIWIRDGRAMIDAPQEFWKDKCRALGLLEFCKDIVKEAKMQEDKPKIIPAKGGIRNFVRNFKRR